MDNTIISDGKVGTHVSEGEYTGNSVKFINDHNAKNNAEENRDTPHKIINSEEKCGVFSANTNNGTYMNTGNAKETRKSDFNNSGSALKFPQHGSSSPITSECQFPSSCNSQNAASIGGSSGSTSISVTSLIQEERSKMCQLVLDLLQSSRRESALVELSKRRESFTDLAPILWYSFGTVAALLQEIICIYPMLSPPSLTAAASNRVCNSLALLQCLASHHETRQLFLNANIPLFLYPFLNTMSKGPPYEYLRLTSLGVIGALVKGDDPEVISFLLQTEIIPLCLRIMKTGSELSRTVATFIVQKILLDELGLNYICTTAERFYAVSTVLSNIVANLVENPSARLLKHIIRCYLRLAENSRAREALKKCLPEALKDGTFCACIKDDSGTKKWLIQLLSIIMDN